MIEIKEGTLLFSIASFLLTAKRYAKNISIANEEFVNAAFLPFIQAASIKDSDGDWYHFPKNRVSELLKNKFETKD